MEESRRLQQTDGSGNHKLRTLQTARRQLPAYQQRQEILAKLGQHSVMVISGSTGKPSLPSLCSAVHLMAKPLCFSICLYFYI